MFDFTRGTFTPEQQPTNTPLSLTPTQDIQIRGMGEGVIGGSLGAVMGGDYVSVPSLNPKLWADQFWTRDVIHTDISNAQYSNYQHFLANLNQGSRDPAAGIGFANDPNQALIYRQMMGGNALEPFKYAPSELSSDALAASQKYLEELNNTINDPNTPAEQLANAKAQAKEVGDKLAYASAQNDASKQVGFNWWNTVEATNPFDLFGLFGDKNTEAGKNTDIVAVLSRKNPNFDPQSFWDQLTADNPKFKQAMLEHGITVDSIIDSPNQEHALFRISNEMVQSDVQQKINSYTPSLLDKAKNFGGDLADFMVNSPTGITVATGGAIIGALGLFAPEAAVGAAAEGTAAEVTGSSLLSMSTVTNALSLYQLPLGFVPEFLEGSTYLTRLPMFFAAGTAASGIGSYMGQAREVAFGNATYFANPHVATDINMSEAALEAFQGGLFMAGVFGLGGGLIGDVGGAFKNRRYGVLYDVENNLRNKLDRRFTFEGTRLGNTLEKFGKESETSIIDMSPLERVKADAILKDKEITPTDLVATTEERAERVETREALTSPEAALSTPEDPGTRRYETETLDQYVSRMAPNRGINNIYEVAGAVAHRTPEEPGRNTLVSTSKFSEMSVQDQIRTLIRTKDVLAKARATEENSVGLPAERERVYDSLEAQRKGLINRLGRTLNREEFKAIKAEIAGKTRETRDVPTLLQAAKNKTAKLADRKAAANEAALQLLETADVVSKSPEKAKVIKTKVPQEVLDKVDAIVVEKKLTGKVSDTTMTSLRKSLLSGEDFTVEDTGIGREISKAINVNRMNPERVRNIQLIQDNYRNFLDVAKGNKENIQKYYDFVNELHDKGILNNRGRTLLLASIVHMDFSKRGFNIEYKVGPIEEGTAGYYDPKTKTLTMSDKVGSSTYAAVTVLHELAHSFVFENATGDAYQNILKLYNRTAEGSIKLLDINTPHADSFLDNRFFSPYHMQNAEELFVESFSHVLLTETSKALEQLKPIEVSTLKSSISAIKQVILQVAHVFSESDYYDSVGQIIDQLTKMDERISKNALSVPQMVDGIVTGLINAGSHEEFTNAFNKFLDERNIANASKINRLTKAEYELLKNSKDPAMIPAVAMVKAMGKDVIGKSGKWTKNYGSFIDSYSQYKEAQFHSMNMKLSYLILSGKYEEMLVMDKADRAEFLMKEIFSVNSNRMFFNEDGGAEMAIIPATSEEKSLRFLPVDSKGAYNTGFMRSTARGLLELPNLPEEVRDGITSNKWLMKSPLENLTSMLDRHGLEDLVDYIESEEHADFVARVAREGLFNIEKKPQKKVTRKLEELGGYLRDAKFLKNVNPEQALQLLGLSSDVQDPYVGQLINHLVENKQLTTTDLISTVMADVKSGKLSFDGEYWTMKINKDKAGEPVVPSAEVAAKIEAGDVPVTKDNLAKIVLEVYGDLVKDFAKSRTGHLEGFDQLLHAILSPESKRANTIVEKYGSKSLVRTYFMKGWENAAKDANKEDLAGFINRQNEKNKSATGGSAADEGTKVSSDKQSSRILDYKDEGFIALRKLHDLYEQSTGKTLFGSQVLDYIDRINRKQGEITDADIANEMNISKGRVSQLKTQLKNELMKTIGYSKDEVKGMSKTEFQELLDGLKDLKVEMVEKTTAAERAKEIPAPPKPTPVEEAKVAAKEIAMEIAIKEKAKKKAATEVVVPVMDEPKAGEIPLAVVETSLVEPQETPVLRPEPVADALVDNEDSLFKSVVHIEKKKTLTLSDSFATPKEVYERVFELLSAVNPEETAKIAKKDRKQFVIGLLKEKGYDSITDGQGNVLPLETPKVKGIRKRTAKPRVDSPLKEEVNLFTEPNGAPVIEETYVPIEQTAPIGEVPTVEQTTESGITTSSVEVPQQVEVTTSGVAKLPETEAMEHKVNAERTTLRDNGMDSNFLKIFTKAYWESGIENVTSNSFTDGFKQAWNHFVLINQYIADANKKVFGNDVMERFWTKVDELRTENVSRKATGKPARSNKDILDIAANMMNEKDKPEFVKPVLPNEFKFVKTDSEGTVRLSGKNKNAKAWAEAAVEDHVEPPPTEPKTTPEGTPIPASPEDAKIVEDIPEDSDPTDKDKILKNAMDNSEEGASRPMLFNNFFGRLFGGDNTEAAGWWQKIMSRVWNFSQRGSKLGDTIRSRFNAVAFASRFAEDTRAQTGHLVSAGTKPFKTMLQCKMDEGAQITRLLKAASVMRKVVGSKADHVAINEYLYDCLRKGETPNQVELVKRGVNPADASEANKAAMYYLNTCRVINERMLYMEKETGRLVSVDKNGIPLDFNTYAPVQIDHEALSRLDPAGYADALKRLVDIRTNTKLNDDRLDMNTLMALGWIDAKWDPKSNNTSLFYKLREYKQSEGTNLFSKDTLLKLRTDESGRLLPEIDKNSIKGSKQEIKNLLKKADPKKRFVIETDDKFTVYRMPTRIEDLAPVDADIYRDTVKGNTALYTGYWKEYLKGKSLIEHEIEELFAYKTKQFPYNRENYGITRPMFKLDPEGNTGITVKGLTPEEISSDPVVKALFRTDLLESYFHWLNGRYFDLNFQMELDRMLGSKGITWKDVLDYTNRSTNQEINKIAKNERWTQGQLKDAQKGLSDGVKRLEYEFRSHADTLPYSLDGDNLGQRAASAAMRWRFSSGFGVTHFSQVLAELAKQYPEFYHIPRNVIDSLRFVFGDRRFSKNKIMMSDISDMPFALEAFRIDFSNAYMGEIGHGPLTMDNPMSTSWNRMSRKFRDATGLGESLVALGENAGDVMHSLGSINAEMMALRNLGKFRMQRELWNYINSDKLDRLIVNLQKPEVASKLAALKKAAASDISKQSALWKTFAGVARESGFGFDQHDAQMFLRYGFTDAEQIKAIRWALNEVKAKDLNGRVDINLMRDLVDKVRREGSSTMDADTLDRAISNYQFMIDDRIAREVVSEGRGLNRALDESSRSAMGRLWGAMTSFLRSYQDNNILNFGNKSTLDYAAAGIFLTGVTTAITVLMKEWMAGRDTKDIIKELEDHPAEFGIRGASRVPFLGAYNGYLEAAMGTASALNGGTFKFHGNPLMGGASAVGSASDQIWSDMKNVASGPDMAHRIKAASGLLGFTEVTNTSPVAIPVRTLQDMGAIEHKSAFGTFLDTIHRNPYPYMSQVGVGAVPANQNSIENTQVNPRNYAMENSMYMDALNRHPDLQLNLPSQPVVRPRNSKIRPVNHSININPTMGVSGILADLLGSDQRHAE